MLRLAVGILSLLAAAGYVASVCRALVRIVKRITEDR